jgi:hypothetical protein
LCALIPLRLRPGPLWTVDHRRAPKLAAKQLRWIGWPSSRSIHCSPGWIGRLHWQQGKADWLGAKSATSATAATSAETVGSGVADDEMLSATGALAATPSATPELAPAGASVSLVADVALVALPAPRYRDQASMKSARL